MDGERYRESESGSRGERIVSIRRRPSLPEKVIAATLCFALSSPGWAQAAAPQSQAPQQPTAQQSTPEAPAPATPPDSLGAKHRSAGEVSRRTSSPGRTTRAVSCGTCRTRAIRSMHTGRARCRPSISQIRRDSKALSATANSISRSETPLLSHLRIILTLPIFVTTCPSPKPTWRVPRPADLPMA